MKIPITLLAKLAPTLVLEVDIDDGTLSFGDYMGEDTDAVEYVHETDTHACGAADQMFLPHEQREACEENMIPETPFCRVCKRLQEAARD